MEKSLQNGYHRRLKSLELVTIISDCNQCCDWWIQWRGPKMIGSYNCPITTVQLHHLSDYNSTLQINYSKIKTVYAPITFEEIEIIVMINMFTCTYLLAFSFSMSLSFSESTQSPGQLYPLRLLESDVKKEAGSPETMATTL